MSIYSFIFRKFWMRFGLQVKICEIWSLNCNQKTVTKHWVGVWGINLSPAALWHVVEPAADLPRFWILCSDKFGNRSDDTACVHGSAQTCTGCTCQQSRRNAALRDLQWRFSWGIYGGLLVPEASKQRKTESSATNEVLIKRVPP